ncbi:MAG: biotin-dependent carboxyltransferase family protein [Bacteroidales bacterium]|nr:MAG: biotin-dependent carboxyltransferase family protein [Bacteroidales bacterium]
MASIIIHSPGLLTTVQDFGRYGYQRFGMPVSGAMDSLSLRLANLLVGNHPNDACLETTLTGPEISFTSKGVIAICGADMNPSINGKTIQLNKTIEVKAGQTLSFEGLNYGCRSYIAFGGGIDTPITMESRSTYLRAKVGGFEGRALKTGDELPLGSINKKIKSIEIPKDFIPKYQSNQIVQIIAGPEVRSFGSEGIRNFLTSEYAISDQSDRMGYRLTGPTIKHQSNGADIISAGISIGTIQITGNGQPIILMADRQTTGGYTRLANLISNDLTLVAQLKPSDRVRFREVSLEKAQEQLFNRELILKKVFRYL